MPEAVYALGLIAQLALLWALSGMALGLGCTLLLLLAGDRLPPQYSEAPRMLKEAPFVVAKLSAQCGPVMLFVLIGTIRVTFRAWRQGRGG